MARIFVRMVSSSCTLRTSNVATVRAFPVGISRPESSVTFSLAALSAVAISSQMPLRSVESISNVVENGLSSVLHATLTQRPACFGSDAPAALRQSRRWMDTP